MNAIHRIFKNGVAIERVTLVRATMNESPEINANLIDDMADCKKIIVDLSFCDYIDSSFFGALVNAYRKMIAKGGSIVLVLSNTFLTNSFIYNDISSIFKVYHSIKEALYALNNPNG
ncbi:MAG: STAS domain-containing protein [Ignavibacteriaceae bacterium]|nr:STAS domain-containing protein [Ignavibacteriaceae bacterium]